MDIKVELVNDDVFICDNCRKEKKYCYKFTKCGYVYLCICSNCFNRLLNKIDLTDNVTTDFIEFRGKR